MVPDQHSNTYLEPSSSLPLTCTRAGTCCHGKMVWINPWELTRLAEASGEGVAAFAERCCEYGGIRLRFDGPPGWKGLPACRLYAAERGCSVHAARPLSCRLYPLGRERQVKTVRYLHQGIRFPCLEGCADVRDLPALTVQDYLVGQDVTPGEAAQDAYLEVMQELAEAALILLIDGGLAGQGDHQVLPRWRGLGAAHPRGLVQAIAPDWLSALTLPGFACDSADPARFAAVHFAQLQERAQRLFASLREADALREASCTMMALALHLGRALGSSPDQLVHRWIITAKKHGARE